MRALVLSELASPPRLGVFTDPKPAGSDQVLEVTAAGLNPFDVVHAAGRHPVGLPPLPSVVGREGIGRTADGRRVYFEGAHQPYGSVAERSLVDCERLFDVGEDVDDAAALAVGAAGITAWLSLVERARLQAGENVLVLGATGAVGGLAIQVAKLLGAGTTIAAGRNPGLLKKSLELGADATVDLGMADLPRAFTEAAGGSIDVIVDLLWGPPARAALAVCSEGGRLIQIGNSAETETLLSASDWRSRWVSLIGYSGLVAPVELKREAYEILLAHVAAGRITVNPETIPFSNAEQAWNRQAAGPNRKLVLTLVE